MHQGSGPQSQLVLERALPNIHEPPCRLWAKRGEALLRGLEGGLSLLVHPAPTRGRPEVLPTGRNFFSIDGAPCPTPGPTWRLSWASAEALLGRHLMDHVLRHALSCYQPGERRICAPAVRDMIWHDPANGTSSLGYKFAPGNRL